EIDFLAIYDTALHLLGLRKYQININNRKLLSGLAEVIGKPEQLTDLTISIDKLDKIGMEGVRQELTARSFSAGEIASVVSFLEISGNNEEKLNQLQTLLKDSETAQLGIVELREVLENTYYSFYEEPVLNPTLARGLDYYTGTIIEVKAPKSVKMGSIGGGGRYDDLTGLFGVEGLSGVGISFGIDRIYDIMEELDLFPEMVAQSTQILFLQVEPGSVSSIYSLLNKLREENIPAEIYPDAVKFKKQMKYANKRAIPYVGVIGEAELAAGTVSVKNMKDGQQEEIPKEDVITYLKDSELT